MQPAGCVGASSDGTPRPMATITALCGVASLVLDSGSIQSRQAVDGCTDVSPSEYRPFLSKAVSSNAASFLSLG